MLYFNLVQVIIGQLLNKPFDTFSDFLKDKLLYDWIIYTDSGYNNFTRYRKYFSIRGWFETLDRQPIIINKSSNLSLDFTNFIDKLEDYFQTTSLELSMLKYKDTNMLNLYKRQKKFQRILK